MAAGSVVQVSPMGVSLATRLRDADTFVEVALAGCVAARAFGVQCAMTLLTSTGEPLITVDSAGDSPDNMFTITSPMLALTEQIGFVRWSSPEPLSAELCKQLEAMTVHVSVRLAQLGFTGCRDGSDQLTARQIDVARLAARGHTNSEIATLLALSENTVKKHLKEVFERLQIASRTELARRYARLATLDDIPDGVTVRDGCTITRGTRFRSRR